MTEAAPAKAKAAAESSGEEESSDEEDDSDDDAAPAKTAAAKAKAEASSEEEDDDDEDDDDDDDDEDEEEEDDEEEPVVKKGGKQAANGVDVSVAKGSKTVFVGNLAWAASEDDVAAFFEECGTVVNVRMRYGDDGRAKGFCHVEFDAVEGAAAAIGKHGEFFMDREIRVDSAEERPNRGGFNNGGGFGGGRGDFGGGRGGRGGGDSDGTTVFVKGFDRNLGEEAVREQLTAVFADCGDVSAVRLPTDRETGELKGIAFVQFGSAEGKVRSSSRTRFVHDNGVAPQQAAADLNGQEAAGGYLTVDLNVGGGGRGGGRGDFGGRGGRGGGFGGRGGGFGGRGGRGGFGGRGRGDFGGRGRGGRDGGTWGYCRGLL